MKYGFDFEKIESEINNEVEAEIKKVLKISKVKKDRKFNVHKELKKGYHNKIIKEIIAGKDFDIEALKMNDSNKGSYYIHEEGQQPRKQTGGEIAEQ